MHEYGTFLDGGKFASTMGVMIANKEKTLDFDSVKLPTSKVNLFLSSIPEKSVVDTMVFSMGKMGDEAISALLDGLAKRKTQLPDLSNISISACRMSDKSIESLLKFMDAFPKLKYIDISENKITKLGLNKLYDTVVKKTNIESFIIDVDNLDDASFGNYLRVVKKYNHSLTTIGNSSSEDRKRKIVVAQKHKDISQKAHKEIEASHKKNVVLSSKRGGRG